MASWLSNVGGGRGGFDMTSTTLNDESLALSMIAITEHNHIHALLVLCLYVVLHYWYWVSAAAVTTGDSSVKALSSSSSSPNPSIILEGGPPSPIRTRSLQSRGGGGSSVDDDGMTMDDDDDSTSAFSSSKAMEDREMALEKQVPDSTAAERQRFLTARKDDVNKAATNLQSYLDWKQQRTNYSRNNTKIDAVRPTLDRDYDLWVEACLEAMQASGEVGRNIVLPRVIRSYELKGEEAFPEHHPHHHRRRRSNDEQQHQQQARDRDGHRIFHIIPALMDDRLAKTSTYALATAIFVDKQFDRDNLEKITVCLDVRAGRGWRNLHAVKLVPFMRESLQLLLSLFPERLHKCIVFPLPPAFWYLWRMVAKCIDPKTRDKIIIATGKCTIDAPPPTEKLAVHLGGDASARLEAYRISCFKA